MEHFLIHFTIYGSNSFVEIFLSMMSTIVTRVFQCGDGKVLDRLEMEKCLIRVPLINLQLSVQMSLSFPPFH